MLANKPTKISLQRSANNSWHIVAAESTTLKDIQNPSYFEHLAQRLSVGDPIIIASPSMQFYVDAVIVSSTKLDAKIMIKFSVGGEGKAVKEESKEVEVSEDDIFFAKYRGKAGWSVIHRQSGKVFKDKMTAKEDAVALAAEKTAEHKGE